MPLSLTPQWNYTACVIVEPITNMHRLCAHTSWSVINGAMDSNVANTVPITPNRKLLTKRGKKWTGSEAVVVTSAFEDEECIERGERGRAGKRRQSRARNRKLHTDRNAMR